ncbi:TIR domain-containing protein [Streptomyces flavalbus]|uniref:TIR domain-containing protein n=1 Tax=Streptomyces flavalbus TaxID=2665155 RepID=A0ABW2WFH7_9ACTN
MSPLRRPPRQLPPVTNLPPLPAPFVGRDEEIADTHRLLDNHRAVLVHDPEDRPHGYGTSHLALSYGHRYTQHYELVWVIDCGGEQDPGRLADLVAAQTTLLGEAFEAGTGEPLTGPTAADWLYVFDNVARPDGIRRHFPEGNARILVASRATGTWPSAARLRVGPLDRDDAVRLLKENMGLEQRHAVLLVDTFGGHPHQIVRAGEAVLAGRVTPEQVVTVTEIARMAPPPPERPPTLAIPRQRRSGDLDAARTSLRSSLLRSTVCRDSGSFRRWMATLGARTRLALPSDSATADLSMAERVELLLDIVFERRDPDFARALADTVAAETETAGSGRQMADTVRDIVGELAAHWSGAGQPPPVVAPEKPSCFFFTSWHNRTVDQEEVLRFHALLEKQVTAKLGGRVKPAGFLDKTIKHGAVWEPKLIEAIRTTRLLVPLITEEYFTREWCRREWAVMMRRLASTDAAPDQQPIAIMPVIWARPLDGWMVPEDYKPYQRWVHSAGKPEWDGDVYDLLAGDRETELKRYVSTLANTMVAEASTPLPPLDRDLVMKVPLAFADVNGGMG